MTESSGKVRDKDEDYAVVSYFMEGADVCLVVKLNDGGLGLTDCVVLKSDVKGQTEIELGCGVQMANWCGSFTKAIIIEVEV